MVLARDDNAAAGTLGFMIAGAILTVLVGALLFSASSAGRDDTGSQAEHRDLDSEAMVDMLVNNKGAGWESGADGLTQLGLRNQNGSGIDLAYMAAMQGALYPATDNDKLDYDEALALMGLDTAGSSGFHLRISPVALDMALVDYLDGIKVAYLGSWQATIGFGIGAGYTVPIDDDEAMAINARGWWEVGVSTVASKERSTLVQLGVDFDDRLFILGAGVEVGLVSGLGVPLDDVVADPVSLLSGDVFPDQKEYLNTVLPVALGAYDILIIGSDVAHSALTSDTVKDTIEAFVFNGGALMVFGSDSQSFQWLQPLIGVGIETANSGAFATDVGHPVLTEPNGLDWTAYGTHNQVWGGQSDFQANFQHVLQDDGGDVLAVSNVGAYGDGLIILSTFRPAEISDNISVDEAEALLNNLVVYHDRSHLFLEFGPSPPADVPVGAASRLTHVWDADLGLLPVRVTVLTWGS
jgi:hypothetical protein